MSFGTSDSAIRMTPALEKEISEALPDQIKSIFARAALEQALVTPDPYNPSLLHPTALADHSPRKFGKVVIINGVKYALEGGSPEELAQAETSLYQQVLEGGDNNNEQARDAQGRFVREQTPEEKAAGELEASKRADLELAWKRGDITAEQYLEKSGAISTYLAEHGMNQDALVAVSDLVYQNTWSQATEQFLNSPEGESWPGGSENLAIATKLLEENPELMNNPSADALAAVWNYMRENDLAVPNPEVTQLQQIGEATDVNQIREALNRPTQSSGLFNYR
jgi:hypothetical protein